MKQTLRYYGPVALVLAVILLVSMGLTLFAGTHRAVDDRPRAVTTVYPLYVAAKAVIGDTDGVVLGRLSGSADGCLHDYQLSPADRIALQQADLLLLNGAGAEVFLDDLLPTLEATVVDTGADVELLCASEDTHDHEEEHHHDHTYNEHIWTSPSGYAAQVAAVTEAMCALDPAHAAAYTANGAAYRRQVLEMGEKLRQAVEKLPGKVCVTFHDSLLYFARDVGLSPAVTLQAGTDAGLSAADLTTAGQVVAENPTALLLYDSQYAVRYTAVDSLVPGAQVLAIDTAVTGEGNATDWLAAMERNLRLLEKLTEETP
ncbi:MAG: zinc ABC transporter substrate-binding protein [Clostridia bacterium]|nr:zinc ABC transporter substrate-binding protein [Clostridia bacterium]